MNNSFSTNAVEPDISLSICGYSKVLDIISNKWTALVIYAMEEGIIRYSDIRRRIEGISKKMLTQTLRQLERDGLVKREITPSVPPIVEYSLTPLGVSLLEPMRALNRWTSQNYVWVEKARASYDQVDQTE